MPNHWRARAGFTVFIATVNAVFGFFRGQLTPYEFSMICQWQVMIVSNILVFLGLALPVYVALLITQKKTINKPILWDFLSSPPAR